VRSVVISGGSACAREAVAMNGLLRGLPRRQP
jgi:hypothetical protein